jgi:acylphosphatase
MRDTGRGHLFRLRDGYETHLSGEPHIIRHVRVRGRVQGVGFRAFVEHHALQRALAGWVRNRRDGTVEAVFAGPQKTVEGMIGACKVGPLSAQVDALDVREGSENDLNESAFGEGFSCLPTL